MTKQPSPLPCSPRGISIQLDAPAVVLWKRTSPLPSPTYKTPLPVKADTVHRETQTLGSSTMESKSSDGGSEGAAAERRGSSEEQQPTGQPDSETRAAADQGGAHQGTVEYEYMDIRSSHTGEREKPVWERRASQASAQQTAETEDRDRTGGSQAGEEVKKGEEVEEEYQYTNKQPRLKESLSTAGPRPDVLTAGADQVEEYEDMDGSGGASIGWERVEYQNLPVKGRAVAEEVGSSRCVGLGGYIKVCAGVGEPSSNTSFDNPDYWHSRLFLKPDAVRT